MTAQDLPTTWSQRCWVSLCVKGGSFINFHSIVDTVDIDEGDRDVSDIPTVGGGRLIKVEPQGMTTVTFEGYSVGIGVTEGNDMGFEQFFADTTLDSTDPYLRGPETSEAGRNRSPSRYKVAILWTDQTLAAGEGATTAITEDYNALRWIATDAYITSLKKSFTDGVRKVTCTLKIPQYQKDGTATISEESCGNAAVLAAVSSYS